MEQSAYRRHHLHFIRFHLEGPRIHMPRIWSLWMIAIHRFQAIEEWTHLQQPDPQLWRSCFPKPFNTNKGYTYQDRVMCVCTVSVQLGYKKNIRRNVVFLWHVWPWRFWWHARTFASSWFPTKDVFLRLHTLIWFQEIILWNNIITICSRE